MVWMTYNIQKISFDHKAALKFFKRKLYAYNH